MSVSGAGPLSQHPKTFPPTLTAAQYSALDPGLTHSSSKTHLEAVFCGYEEHFKGLPPLEGDAGAPLLAAPFALLFSVEDNLGRVEPRVKVQGGVCPLLLAAQQVYMEPAGNSRPQRSATTLHRSLGTTTPTQSPCVYSQDPVPDAGAVLEFWCDGRPAVPILQESHPR